MKSLFSPEEFHDNMGFTPKEFPNFWPLPLKNSTTFIPYPCRIPLFLNRGAPILNGIAHYECNREPTLEIGLNRQTARV